MHKTSQKMMIICVVRALMLALALFAVVVPVVVAKEVGEEAALKEQLLRLQELQIYFCLVMVFFV